jgi:hypothetical protein
VRDGDAARGIGAADVVGLVDEALAGLPPLPDEADRELRAIAEAVRAAVPDRSSAMSEAGP